MDWDWLVSTFDDTTTLNKQFTKLDLALLSSALLVLENETEWSTGDYDVISAKLADIQAELDDD